MKSVWRQSARADVKSAKSVARKNKKRRNQLLQTERAAVRGNGGAAYHGLIASNAVLLCNIATVSRVPSAFRRNRKIERALPLVKINEYCDKLKFVTTRYV